jgi:hypothetical protein
MPLHILNPFLRIIGCHFPESGDDRSGYAFIVFDCHSITYNCSSRFLARMLYPYAMQQRWSGNPLGGPRGRYIVGSLTTQSGLGGDFAYSAQYRYDPPEGPTPTGPLDSLELPDSELGWYLWHCGNNFRLGQYQSCIVNLRTIFADFGTEADPYPMTQIEMASRGGDGNLEIRYRMFGGVDPAVFSFGAGDEVLCSLPQVAAGSVTVPASIVWGVKLFA